MPSLRKERLDVWLVEKGLVPSRDAARRLVLAGKARVNDQPATKPGQRYPEGAKFAVIDPPEPYVGRGGRKLRKALDHFGIAVTGAVALDVGASTGGFTDCLLQAGAARVYAIDVGHNQLDWRLRSDPRVICHEKVNARYLTEEHVPEMVDIVVMDVSFISASKVLPAALARLKTGGRAVVLVKPQFEVGAGEVGKGGIVRDKGLHERVVAEVSLAAEEMGLRVDGVTDSPVLGADGNREFLLAATKENKVAQGT